MPKINNSGFNTHEYKYYLMILVKQQCTCFVGMMNNLVNIKNVRLGQDKNLIKFKSGD